MRRGVLVLAAGAGWEPEVLALMERDRAVVLLRRCVDIDDLLASLALGQAEGAVVSLDAPGLDADAVAQIHRAGVTLIAVLPALVESASARAARIGISLTVEPGAVADLPRLLATGPGAAPASRATAPSPELLDAADPYDPAYPAGPDGPDGAERSSTHRVLTVCGTRGATGASTVAVALAALLARRSEAVTLIDADSGGGSVAQQLGVLDEVSGLLAVARLSVAGEVGASWLRAARTLAPGWLVVTGVPRSDRWRELPAGALEELIQCAGARGWVVVDAGADPSPEALGAADEVIVVGLPDPIGLTRLCRALAGLGEQSPPPIRVVINRWRRSVASAEAEVTALLGAVHPVKVHCLPEDQGAADRAGIAQRAVVDVAPQSAWSLELGHLADAVGAVAPARVKAGARRRRADTTRRR